MIVAVRRPCSDHRTVLLDWVDGRAADSRTRSALAHLDRCPDCERELAGVALAIVALRRLHRDLSAVEPPADAWVRLRARVTRPADRWRGRTTLGGTVASTLLVAVVFGSPMTARLAIDGGTVPPAPARLPASPAELAVEAAYINGVRVVRPAAPEAGRTRPVSIPRLYPDGVRPAQKEVRPDNADGRRGMAI